MSRITHPSSHGKLGIQKVAALRAPASVLKPDADPLLRRKKDVRSLVKPLVKGLSKALAKTSSPQILPQGLPQLESQINPFEVSYLQLLDFNKRPR